MAQPLLSVSVEITPHDRQDLHAHSIQVPTDASIQLSWETKDAAGILIDGLGSFGPKGSTALPARDASYSIVAVGAAGQSAPWPLDVSTHEPGEVFSQHISASGGHPALQNPAVVKGIEGTIDSTNCDQLLRRGDILIKFAGEQSSVTEKVIMNGEKVTQKLAGLFHQNLQFGDAGSFHAALYLGGGRTAEAHGGQISTARVGTRSIDDHGGFLFQVYRPKDQLLADAAAKVAEAWCDGRRMHYKVPALVPFQDASYGPHARKEALDYATHADSKGGPPGVSAMFCSQFVVACYQAAAGAALMRKKGKLPASKLDMPAGIDLQASHTSPMALDAQLVQAEGRGVWEHACEILVRPEHAGSSAEVKAGPDHTGKMVDLGIPTGERWKTGNDVYARNPWDLRAFAGKLFVASGNANNPGPAPNQGPVDLWAWDKKGWKSEYTVQDEQVDVMPVLDGQLYIPGIDTHIGGKKISTLYKAVHVPEDWAYGNLHHRKAGGAWEQLRSIPNGIHVYDAISFAGQLFAGTGTLAGGTVAHSKDGGKSWKEMGTHTVPGQRTRSFFVLGGKLYASTTEGLLYVWDGAGTMTRVYGDLFPGLDDNTTLHCARPVTFKDRAVYIAARKLIDHDWTAEGLFTMSAPDECKLLALPGGALARDLRVIDGDLYILATQQPTPDSSRTRLFATSDLETFREVLRFDGKTYARSFDRLDGEWYFGLGSDPEWLSAETGRILRAP